MAFARAGGPAGWWPLVVLGWARDNPDSGVLRRLGLVAARPRLLRGVAVDVDPHDLAQLISFEEVFVEGTYDLTRVPFVPTTVIDCGAHVGYFTLLAGRWFTQARRIVFEPSPTNLPRLRQNLTAVGDCVVHEAAVSTWSGRGRFVADLGNTGRLSSGGSEGIEVPVVDLAPMVPMGDGEALLMKVDVEGEERCLVPHVLAVLPATCALFIETHEGRRVRQEMVTLLEAAGFSVTLQRCREPFADILAIRGGA